MTPEPTKPIKRTKPRPESDSERQVLAQVTDADVAASKAIVEGLKASGTYTEGAAIKRIAGRVARKYWGVE